MLPRLRQKKHEKAVEDAKWGGTWTDLSANANLAGRMGMSGAVKKATKKQTAAPNRHAPKPINLERAGGGGEMVHMQSDEKVTFNTCLSHLESAK